MQVSQIQGHKTAILERKKSVTIIFKAAWPIEVYFQQHTVSVMELKGKW